MVILIFFVTDFYLGKMKQGEVIVIEMILHCNENERNRIELIINYIVMQVLVGGLSGEGDNFISVFGIEKRIISRVHKKEDRILKGKSLNLSFTVSEDGFVMFSLYRMYLNHLWKSI